MWIRAKLNLHHIWIVMEIFFSKMGPVLKSYLDMDPKYSRDPFY